MGRIAIDDGDKEAGIRYLQHALATLDWYFRPMFPRIVKELADLGAEPLPEESSGQILATPMPAIASLSGLKPGVTDLTDRGFPKPPNVIPVNITEGTGYIVCQGSIYPYPVYLFRPQTPVSIESVQSLAIHLEPASRNESESFEIFLWNLTNGQWDMLKPGWGSVTIEEPQRYVDFNGETYIAIRLDNKTMIHFQNVWLTIGVTDTGGAQTTLGFE